MKALQENGINARSYTGKNAGVRDQSRKDFQDGKIDVLVCTKAAERGLTLHKASAIVHYDIPWTLERIIQRTGRGIRIGSTNDTVDIIFLVMGGTVEERIAQHLTELGIASTMVLDNSRGVDLSKTDTVSAMGGLLTGIGARSDKKSLQDFGKKFLGI
jgi:superfamily II DNA/RNA helicase